MVFNDTRIITIKQIMRKTDSKIWKAVVRHLNKQHEINIGKLSKITNKDDIVAMPGKVLGTGVIDHPITIGATAFSENAHQKIINAGGKIMFIEQLVENNPEGKGVRLLVG
ncbi:MAG: 50S ribosomal protein L18e [Thaumarchaeota archaeon]|nr:50S ribosomal protein L18e [Nitrososphaerota archaeon]